ncbi:hypothetical protein OCV58_10165 [Megasphaera butyrica]|uniref:hypothetical protein n=1 Tax=Megasphaera butyrica TaxID=2981791 RepID=UPI000821FAC9|nr:hypothetical protein [Megasphaera butyrica]MCU6715269.1 hypothetical protein [Megasphaera butyrica]SCI01181.1 Uncharacterised protein [uncultured Megasphaera sp.]SCJ58539.1 Uncharacterised protein [uncultured Ruminococcus sp.]
MAVNIFWGMLTHQERKEVLDGSRVLEIMDKTAKSFLFWNHKLKCGVIGYRLQEYPHEIHIPDNALVIDIDCNNIYIDQSW